MSKCRDQYWPLTPLLADNEPASKKKLKKKKRNRREEDEEEEEEFTAVKDVCVDTKDEQATNTVTEQQQQVTEARWAAVGTFSFNTTPLTSFDFKDHTTSSQMI